MGRAGKPPSPRLQPFLSVSTNTRLEAAPRWGGGQNDGYKALATITPSSKGAGFSAKNSLWLFLTCADPSFQMWPRQCLVAQAVKNLPAMQKGRVRSLGQEDPLEKVMATSTGPVLLTGKSHGQRSLEGNSPWGS